MSSWSLSDSMTTMPLPPRTNEERLAAKLRLTKGGCWIWTGSLNKRDGYGQFAFNMGDGSFRTRPAHRVAYELWVGPIPEGRQIHHRCEQRLCCNPAHLLPQTRAEHGEQHRREKCRRGHPLSGDNLYVYKGRRNCKACNVLAKRRSANRKKGT